MNTAVAGAKPITGMRYRYASKAANPQRILLAASLPGKKEPALGFSPALGREALENEHCGQSQKQNGSKQGEKPSAWFLQRPDGVFQRGQAHGQPYGKNNDSADAIRFHDSELHPNLVSYRCRAERLGISIFLQPKLSDSNFGFCGRARWGLPSAWAAAKDPPASTTPPGVREPPHRQRRSSLSWGAVFRGFRSLSERPCCRCDGRRRDCGGPSGRQTPSGLDVNRHNRSI